MFVSFAPSNRLTVERLEGRDLASATFAGTDVFAFGFQPEAAGTHILYQDITIPANQSTGVATLVGVSNPTGESKEGIVTIGEIKNVSTPQGKAVLFVRKAGGERPID